MSGQIKRSLAVWLGVAIVLLDIFWVYIDYRYPVAVALGVIIFIASVIWLYFDV